MKPQAKPNDVASKLRAAKALIATPETWCQGTLEDGGGRYCALGAANHLGFFWSVEKILNRAAEEMGFCTDDDDPGAKAPAAFLNDITDHAIVMRMFDRAIELAEAQQ